MLTHFYVLYYNSGQRETTLFSRCFPVVKKVDAAFRPAKGESMKKEFIVERQGKSFVLYAGLLDLAHQNGLKSIKTELVQIPQEANNRVAIAVATVVLQKEGIEYTFTGIGDAAPNNVAPAMQTCLIRMAETRSKARALRDAVNVGVTALEELGDEGAHDGAPERGYAVSPKRGGNFSNNRNNGNSSNSNPPARNAPRPTPSVIEEESAPELVSATNSALASDGLSEQQADAIRNLCKRRGMEPETLVKEKYQLGAVSELSQSQASELIRTLNQPQNGRTPVSAG